MLGIIFAAGLVFLAGGVYVWTSSIGQKPEALKELAITVGGRDLARLSYASTVPLTTTMRGVNVFPKNGTRSADGAGGFMSYSDGVVNLLEGANVKILRFPGGNWGDEHTLSYDQIDAFISLCRKLGAEPAIQVRLRGGSVQEALDLIDYTNNPDNPVRRQRQAPYERVKYWMIGNEPSGYASWGNYGSYTAEDYTRDFISYATALKQADPSIMVVGDEQHQYSVSQPVMDSTGKNWMQTFLNGVAAEEKRSGKRLLDIVSFHRYPLHKYMDEKTLLTDAPNLRKILPDLRAKVEAAFGEQRPIAVTETNGIAVYSSSNGYGEDVMADGLWWADTYATLAAGGIDYIFFFAAQGLDPPLTLIDKNEQPLPTYYAFSQTAELQGAISTQSYWTPELSIYVSDDSQTGSIRVMLLNKTNQRMQNVSVRPTASGTTGTPASFDLSPLSVTVMSLEKDQPTKVSSYGIEQAQQRVGIKQVVLSSSSVAAGPSE